MTTGDNIYASKRFLRWTADSGDEDDDWFFTYFQPYRYVLNRLPVCPTIGNHDTRETEEHDDREQVMDNMYLRERLAGEEAAGRASVNPGLFYRFRVSADVEIVCFDTSKEEFFRRGRLFEYPKHWDFMRRSFPPRAAGGIRWRIPFAITPRFAPVRSITTPIGWKRSSGCSSKAASGRRSAGTSTTSSTRNWNGIDYFVTGAGSKIRRRSPTRFESAHTQSWSGQCHFLLVTIHGDTMTVRAIGESEEGLVDIPRLTPAGEVVQGPIVVTSA